MKYKYPASISTPEARKVYRRLMREITKLKFFYGEFLYLYQKHYKQP